MWSDNETEIDLVDFTHLIAAVRSIISNKSLHPATIGIYGDWGSGKSSLMRMVHTAIEKSGDKKVMAIQFNGWLFESYEDAKSALMGTILDEIASKRTLGPKGKELLVKLMHKIDWMRISVGVGKYLAARAVAGDLGLVLTAASDIPVAAKAIADTVKDISPEDAEKLLKEDGTERGNVRMAIRDFHDDFNKLLKESDVETLVVFIDDLDRCNPETVIDIFEAIRLFLFVPNSVFVIAADEDLIRFAVSTKFPGFQERSGIGRDYLEKLIQYPVKVPALGRGEIETYIKLLFVNSPNVKKEDFEQIRSIALEKALSSFQFQSLDYEGIRGVVKDVPAEIIDGFSLAESLAPILAAGLSGNPRQTKRFLNTLSMRIEMAQARGITLGLRVLAKLMLMEYFQTEAFKQLAELQASQDGKPRILRILEQRRELSGFRHDESKEQEAETEGRDEAVRLRTRARVEAATAKTSVETSALDRDEASVLQAWETDKWIKSWLSLEPALSGIDLRPYFYFSRDNLAFSGSIVRRMSPAAQKMLTDLLGQSEVVRRKALEGAMSLDLADANSILSSLAERFRNNDDPSIKESIVKLMFDFVEKRTDNISQMITFLRSIPETMIPIVAAVRLVGISRGREEQEGANVLLQEWAANKLNPSLARAASGQMKGLTKQNSRA